MKTCSYRLHKLGTLYCMWWQKFHRWHVLKYSLSKIWGVHPQYMCKHTEKILNNAEWNLLQLQTTQYKLEVIVRNLSVIQTAVLTMSTGLKSKTSKVFSLYLELYKNRSKNLIRTSKFICSFRGLRQKGGRFLDLSSLHVKRAIQLHSEAVRFYIKKDKNSVYEKTVLFICTIFYLKFADEACRFNSLKTILSLTCLWRPIDLDL